MSHFGHAAPGSRAAFHAGKYAVFMAAFGAFFILGGGGVDLARAYLAEDQLRKAVGQTARDLVPTVRLMSALDLQEAGERRMEEALEGFDDPDAFVSVSSFDQEVRVSAAIGLPTAFLWLFNRYRLPVEATATARARPRRANVLT